MALTVGELVAYLDIDEKGWDRGLNSAQRALRSMQGAATNSMSSIESAVSRSMADVTRDIGDAFDPGEALADVQRLVGGFKSELDSTDDIAGRAGRRAGNEFVDQARDALRALRYGEFDVDVEIDVDADVSRALAALKAVEAAADEVGQHGERSAGGMGKAFGGALSVVGDLGPAKVAGLVAAMAALPAVANLASAGIVSAIGGGLLAVGLTSAATADSVQHAWSETVAEIKKELGDAAQPLEGSAIRAAEVTRRTFEQLKPSLSRIWRDLVPDVDRFVQMVGQGVGSLGPVLERIGDSFGNVLSELGNRMPVIIQNISASLDTFTQILDEDPQMLANLVEDATELVKVGAEVLSWADELKTAFMAPFGPAGSQQGTDYFFRQVFGQSPQEIEQGMEQLPILLAKMQTQAAAGAAAIANMGDDADGASSGVRNLNAALEEFFQPAQDALSASNNWSRALREAHDELKKGKPDVLDRREQLENLLGSLAKMAQTERESTGSTKTSTQAFKDNADMLAELAGKSAVGGQALVGLAQSLGLTVERTKNGIVVTDQFGKTVAKLPANKNVKVDADTKQAQTEVGKVKTGLDKLPADARQAGKDMGSGLTAGIRSMIGDAIAAAKSLAQSALDAAKNALGIHSPSTVFADVGRWTVRGLIQGLTEEQGNAVSTVQKMVEQIKEAFGSKPDVADHLLAFVMKGNDSLSALAKQREDLVQRLADAKEKAKAIAGDAKEWASITGLSEDELNSGNFSGALKSRAQQIKDFANDIQTLARRGLNKETLRQIIDAGVEGGSSLAEMLVGAPGSEIKAINKAQAQIDKMSKQLGKTGADALYDTGKKAGEGYLKGLQDSLAKLDAEMTKIVKALVKAIKRELKIKSPSLVMAEIGGDTMAGLAVGITGGTGAAVGAMQGAASSVVAAAAGSLGGLVPGGLPGSAGPAFTYAGAPGTGVAMPTLADMYGPGASAGGGTTINVTLPDATIREEADVPKLGREIAYVVATTP
ncbi:hypothetical protein [Nonomuraea angiospora]|uniref:hypothetical protein n=1 Tax=Nonomuraea angiospora TaxID=46172 RepID=UPI0029B904D6|nr:hypothetical protein [Nonomuraea angiospora]MDX3099691.1 hypothetical protein [Nonomuraea angiospora]